MGKLYYRDSLGIFRMNSLFVFNIHVACFPVSEYGDSFCVVARNEEEALSVVSEVYAERALDDDGDELGRDDPDTLVTWWKNPYTNRSGSTTGISITRGPMISKIAGGLALMSSIT